MADTTFKKVIQMMGRAVAEYVYDVPPQENIYPVLAGETTFESKMKFANTGDMQSFLERVAIQSTWIYSNVDFISKLGGVSEFHVWEKGQSDLPDRDDVVIPKATKATTHPLDKLLNNPNKWMSGSFLRMYTLQWLLLRGEAYWMFIPDKSGELVEIWPIPSDRIKPIASEKDYIEAFEYTPREGGVPIPLSSEYIVFFRKPNIFNYHRGLSNLTALKTAIDLDTKAQSWNIDAFNNELNLRTLVSLPSTISQRNYKVIKQELIEELVNKKKRYIIARAGEVSAEQIGLAHKDVEYLAGRKFTREEIDRVMGLPGGFWSEDATESNMNVAKEIVLEVTIWPLINMMAEDLTTQILNVWWPANTDKELFEVRADDPRPKNRLIELEEERRDFETMTVNEVRMFKGREPFQNGYGSLPWVMRQTEQAVKLFLPDGMSDTTVNEDGVLETSQTAVGTYNFEAPEDPNEITPEEVAGEVNREGNVNGELTPSGSIAGTNPPIRSKKAEAPSSEPVEEISKEQEEMNDKAMKALIHQQSLEMKRWKTVAEKSVERAEAFNVEFITKQDEFNIKSAFLFGNPVEVLHHYEDYKSLVTETTYSDNLEAQNVIVALLLFLNELSSQYKDGVIDQETFLRTMRIEFNSAVYRLVELGSDVPFINWSIDTKQQIIEELNYIYDSLGKISRRVYDIRDEEEQTGNIVPIDFTWLMGIIGLHLGSIYYRSMLFGEQEVMLTWRLGNTIEHCGTCAGFNGQTKTAKEWDELGTWPRAKNGTLECGGWNCDCYWVKE